MDIQLFFKGLIELVIFLMLITPIILALLLV